MQWDLGFQGVGMLFVMSIVFGAMAQAAFLSRATWWVGLAAAATFFVAGILVSEGMFGWATATELQPNVDGLSFDEVLMLYAIGIPIVLVARYLARDWMRSHSSTPPSL